MNLKPSLARDLPPWGRAQTHGGCEKGAGTVGGPHLAGGSQARACVRRLEAQLTSSTRSPSKTGWRGRGEAGRPETARRMVVARAPIARRSTVPLVSKNFHSAWVGVDGAMLRLGGEVYEGACRKASVVLELEGTPISHSMSSWVRGRGNLNGRFIIRRSVIIRYICIEYTPKNR